jgi:ribosomal protein S18 acetylase RimI-like enzyme
MEIRRLTIADYDEIVKLWSTADLPFKPKGRDSKEAIEAEMRANPDFFLGAFEDGHLVAIAVVSCDLRKGWINRLAVHPNYRHRGIAKTLIDECERTLRKRGVKLFCVLIEDYNSSSRQLFKKCGYVEHGEILYFSKRESNDV